MRATLGRMGVLLVAGCATASPATVALRPIAEGRPAERAEYLLADPVGRAVGRVTLVGGGIIRERGAEFVEVSIVVQNSDAQKIALPPEEIYLTSLGSERLAPIFVNENEPRPFVISEGAREAYRLRFSLPGGLAMERVRVFQLHWAVSVDDRTPAVRSTAFAAIPSSVSYGETARRAPEPGAFYHQINDMAFRREEMMRGSHGLRAPHRAF